MIVTLASGLLVNVADLRKLIEACGDDRNIYLTVNGEAGARWRLVQSSLSDGSVVFDCEIAVEGDPNS